MSPTAGIALLCDEGGFVERVLSDPSGLGAVMEPGMPFARMAAHGGMAKALSFVTEVNSQGAAFDWEINIMVGEGIKTLHFTGSKINGALLIVAAESSKYCLKLYQEMIQMSNEQANALRSASKQPLRSERDDSEFDEISRLNNELISMQRELAKKNVELEALNQEKNHFLGMAAHDLRNPLQAILSHSAFLLDEDPASLGIDYRNFLEVIFSSSEYMAELIDDLLDVAKIESGQLHLEYSAVDLNALVAHNVALNRVMAAKKQTRIELITDPILTAIMDRVKMEQVLNNLLGNAIKFSKPGSKVVMALRDEGDRFLLSVKDEGPGISSEEIAKMAMPFQMGQARGTAGEKSTGLGLLIVKRIVEGHGGRLWMESELGTGTTFFVSAPLRPADLD